jgi:hypothetical protein
LLMLDHRCDADKQMPWYGLSSSEVTLLLCSCRRWQIGIQSGLARHKACGRTRRQRADDFEPIIPSVSTLSVSGVRYETDSSIGMNCVPQEGWEGSARSWCSQQRVLSRFIGCLFASSQVSLRSSKSNQR